jgi:hypothetical protein
VPRCGTFSILTSCPTNRRLDGCQPTQILLVGCPTHTSQVHGARSEPGELSAPSRVGRPRGRRLGRPVVLFLTGDLRGVWRARCHPGRPHCRRDLRSGEIEVGAGRSGGRRSGLDEPYLVLNEDGNIVEAVSAWERYTAVSDQSPRTIRSFCYAALLWFRVLWQLDVAWDRATEEHQPWAGDPNPMAHLQIVSTKTARAVFRSPLVREVEPYTTPERIHSEARLVSCRFHMGCISGMSAA